MQSIKFSLEYSSSNQKIINFACKFMFRKNNDTVMRYKKKKLCSQDALHIDLSHIPFVLIPFAASYSIYFKCIIYIFY